MEEAKLLGGVVAVVLGLLVNAEAVEHLGHPLEVRLAAVSFLVSLVLFLGTVDAYDSLLMPREYWDRGFRRWKHNTRRRKEDPRTLRDAMIHSWRWFSCPAAVALVLGVTLLADAAVDPRWSWRIVGAVAVVIAVAYDYLARPISVKSRDS